MLYTLFGVGEDVGDLATAGQVAERVPPAGEVLHVGGAAVIDLRRRVRRRHHFCLSTIKHKTHKHVNIRELRHSGVLQTGEGVVISQRNNKDVSYNDDNTRQNATGKQLQCKTRTNKNKRTVNKMLNQHENKLLLKNKHVFHQTNNFMIIAKYKTDKKNF